MISRQSLIALAVALVLGALAVYLANVFLTNTEMKAAKASEGISLPDSNRWKFERSYSQRRAISACEILAAASQSDNLL